jgi:hypothetical protein
VKYAQLQPLEQLSPDELALQVRVQIRLYLSGQGTQDERYCLELIRRIAASQDSPAWAVLYAQFAPLVLSWLARGARGREAIAIEGPDVLVNLSFTKLWGALRSGTKRFNTVGEFLSYLKACTASVLADWWRELPSTLRPGNEAIEDTSGSDRDAPEPGSQGYRAAAAALSDDPADEVIARLSFLELYEIVQGALQDEAERAIVNLSLLCDFTPKAIYQERQDLFPSVEDVYRVKRNVLERLQRNRQVRDYVLAKTGKATSSVRQAPSRDQRHGKKQCSPSRSHGDDPVRRQQELAQQELLALIEQRALSLARTDLLKIVEEQAQHIADQTESCKGEGVSYSRRITYCGKPGCRRCRDRMGHGPYWYASKSVRGRTVSVYLGKDLVPLNWDGDRPPSRKAREHPSAQQRKAAVTYHLQVSYCGKASCHRCRDGVGHGPYWYAYKTINGRTVRSYIGKIQPDKAPSASPIDCSSA